jgi:Holliday junction resolvase RusA-like endonuclease
MVAVHFRNANVPVASGRRRLNVTFTNPRPIDPDNCLKSLCDALSKCRAILDDDPGSLELGSIVAARGPRSTRIELEDLD